MSPTNRLQKQTSERSKIACLLQSRLSCAAPAASRLSVEAGASQPAIAQKNVKSSHSKRSPRRQRDPLRVQLDSSTACRLATSGSRIELICIPPVVCVRLPTSKAGLLPWQELTLGKNGPAWITAGERQVLVLKKHEEQATQAVSLRSVSVKEVEC